MPERTDNKNRRVLVIDDNRAIHDDFRKILCPNDPSRTALNATEKALFGDVGKEEQKNQFEVDSAYQGQEGVQLVKKALEAGMPYALAFVDVRMPPGWDGIETAKKIWEITPDVQIVICTAYSDYSWDEMFEQLGPRDGLLILKKPFDSVEASQMAHALTEKWWLHRQSERKLEELEGAVAGRTQELVKSLSLLNATFESMTDGIVAVDRSGKIISYNTKITEIWQFPSKMLARGNAAELRAHMAGQIRDSEMFLRRVKQLVDAPEAEAFDVFELKDGRTFERYVFPQRIDHVCVGTVINWRDTTKRTQNEEALQRQQSELRVLFDLMPAMIWFKDTENRILRVNQRVAESAGKSVAEIEGRPSIDIYPEDSARFYADDQEVVRSGKPKVAYVETIRDRNNKELWVQTDKVPYRDKDGKVIGIVVMAQDITERKRLESQLFESQKMETVGKLAGGIAHEFNSILTAIIGQSELLLADLPPGGVMAKSAVEISKAAVRAATLTRQLLAYSRKQLLHPEPLDLNRVLAGMEGILHHLMGGEVSVTIVAAAGLATVKADAGQIEQVIMNIAVNARDAMPNGGKLILETANVTFHPDSVGLYTELKPGNYVMLAITDTGTGMSAEVKARIFEPFFSTKGVGEGTGLGLSTCYGIVKQSGGHISVYSEQGRGTTFKIYLPQIEVQAATPAPRTPSPDLPRGTETILLVEDDPALREMAATLLKRLGYTVLAAANGIEALNLQQQRGTGHIDLLFTDVVMPHMSGRELAGRVKALFPHTKILFTSAYTETAIVHQGGLDKGVVLLQKPFTPSALARKLRDVLDQPGPPL